MNPIRRALNRAENVGHLRLVNQVRHRRGLLTLAIETSCDDTSVAILENITHSPVVGTPDSRRVESTAAAIHFHKTSTANTLAYKGIHPVVAQQHHQDVLPGLVSEAVHSLPEVHPQSVDLTSERCLAEVIRVGNTWRQKPNFVTATRGPGMRSNLFTGLCAAKGLAAAWDIPLVGVNHMQAHALTPRLVSALDLQSGAEVSPRFPFLSLLVSGGHTMLIHSKGLCDHPTLATTADIAVGDALDKIARSVLPEEVVESSQTTGYGSLLESFAFPDANYNYTPPKSWREELFPGATRWGWKLGVPLANRRAGIESKEKVMEFSFSGLCSSATDVLRKATNGLLEEEERQELAREAMRVAFEHLASCIVRGLGSLGVRTSDGGMAHSSRKAPSTLSLEMSRLTPSATDSAAASSAAAAPAQIETIVVSGGVAANKFLRHLLRAYLDYHGYSRVELVFPPVHLCTDNAAMIGWAGMEMFEAGWTSDLSCRALPKWSLDPSNPLDGGILGVEGWQRAS